MRFSFKKQSATVHSDEQLMQRLVNGDSSSFNEIYQRYHQRLLYYFYRMLGNSNEKAQDFLQDIFMKLIDKAESFDTSRKFSTWIFSVAHNMCKNEYRRLEARKDTVTDVLPESLFVEEDSCYTSEEINLEEFTRDLFEELETFDDMHKTAFLLHYREGFSVRDIGQVMEISEGTVKSRLFYTRKRLSERLVKYKIVKDNIRHF
jgi:RNA polymerase sigma-70 factor, ECF subfamily